MLESSPTKRDVKGYLQKYTNKNPKTLTEAPKFVQGEPHQQKPDSDAHKPAHVAIVKLRVPQQVDSQTLRGVAKTLSQLRQLGLICVVVVDCGIDEHRTTFQDQAFRLCEAIDSYGGPGATMIKNILSQIPEESNSSPSIAGDVKVDNLVFIDDVLHQRKITIIPSIGLHDEISPLQPIDANKVVVALTKYFTGPQPDSHNNGLGDSGAKTMLSSPIASVERVIILDPLGGTPLTGRPGFCHRFINLEQEYGPLLKQLKGPDGSPLADEQHDKASATAHDANLTLIKDTLSLLPHTSSALITTPDAAANLVDTEDDKANLGFAGLVTTRRKKNPLLYNLLTDKPVYSSSLPIMRTTSSSDGVVPVGTSFGSTLLKKGMPLKIFPDPRQNPWVPPKPGSPRLRLTDKCIDLPRLVHLIDDSFNRKLDVEDYLNRVNENLAGVIVAGDYEGGAILTWERPARMDEKTAHEQGRFVPYLDKFAVLKRSQGSGGVADIVFNAMVRDCFPHGVSWRSRKDNPVNKWYFERSLGTNKLSGCNWTMFWTTPDLDNRHPTLDDYEDVCRSVEPSWADNKHILD